MTTFAIELSGLEEVLTSLNNRIPKDVALGVGKAAIQLETALITAAVDTYSVSTKEVRNLLLKKSVSTVKRGRNVLRAGIEFRYKAKPLHTFPFKEFTVPARSRFIIPTARKTYLLKKQTAKAVAVAVRRNNYKTVLGKRGYKGFYQRRSSVSKWAAIQGGESKSRPAGIYERQQNATWIKEPISRAPISRLFGSAVTEMLEVLLSYDDKVQRAVDNFDEIILKDFLKNE